MKQAALKDVVSSSIEVIGSFVEVIEHLFFMFVGTSK